MGWSYLSNCLSQQDVYAFVFSHAIKTLYRLFMNIYLFNNMKVRKATTSGKDVMSRDM